MAILTSNEIKKRLGKDIKIKPLNLENINPNSIDLTLGDKLMIYSPSVLDPRKKNETIEIEIPEAGYVLNAGHLYLGTTSEYTETKNLVPLIEGKSSIARLGLFVHVTAGFGDVGFSGQWTLEFYPTKDIIIYPGMKICQICYHTIEGEPETYAGKYQGQTGIRPSDYWIKE